MKNSEFDRLLSEIRSQETGDAAAKEAAGRVWNRIARPDNVDAIRLEGCGAFQSLIPSYLAHSLSESRALLFDDHIHECVGCRRELELERGGSSRAAIPLPTSRTRASLMPWAIAAMLVLGIAIGSYGGVNGLFPWQHAVRATVQSMQGSLYRVSAQRSTLLASGYAIGNGDEIRTTRGSRALVRLTDGSLLEMGERADLAVFGGWRGTTVRLERGPLIVQAAKQGLGHLYVATGDCLVSVKGTIFSVNHGAKGSRVSVIEGKVQVDQGSQTKLLAAGEQATTNPALFGVPISREIAWSQNAPQYLALLGEFSTLRKELAAIPSPGLRYQSDLLKYVPENTVIYAAIPNIGTTLAEADRIFKSRLEQSAVLREWWNQQQSSSRSKIQDAIDKVKALSAYLGPEIVITAGKNGETFSAPLILAEVTQSGLRSFLEQQAPGSGLQIADNPAFTPSGSGPMRVYLKNNLLAASPDAGQLRYISTLIDQEASSRFSQTALYRRLAQSYQDGTGWLFAADMEQMLPVSVKNGKDLATGMSDAKFLVLERREVGAQTETRASISFGAERHGMAAWLAAPGPMGSLDFVSPNASLAMSFVINNPRTIIEQLLSYASTNDPGFTQQLSDFESKTGVNVLNDIAAPLGGEVTFAMDGPLLPVPSWKMICEVDDPVRLEGTISKLVQSFDTFAPADAGQIQLSQTQQGAQVFYTLTSTRQAGIEVDYTFVDSYWIAAPSRALLLTAIQDRENGFTLPRSSAFRALLPNNGIANFSAILYHNLGTAVGPLADAFRSTGLATPQQQKSIDALQANSAPGLIYAYGEPDRIVVASDSGFLGMNLDTLLTMNTGGAFLLPGLMHLAQPHER